MAERNTAIMPVWDPPFGPPPYPMLYAELLLVEFETHGDELLRITPPPFTKANHNRVTVFVGDCSQLSHSLFYHEAAFVQPIEYSERQASTIPYIWTSTDTAMLAGRELYGMPKMLCDHESLHLAANQVVGRLHRNGTLMLELAISIDAEADPQELPFKPPFAFLRHVPSPDPEWPALQHLIWVEPQNFQAEFCWRGRGEIHIYNALGSAFGRLQPERVTGAWYAKLSWTLAHARILEEFRS